MSDWDKVAEIAQRAPGKCPECKGKGTLMKLWPLYAISMPHELAWQRFTCWRCKGGGHLLSDDPYVARPTKTATAALIWFWAFAASTFGVIVMLLWL